MVLRLGLAALLLSTTAALAQDITKFAVPYSGGPGVVGWLAIGPCAAGQGLGWPNGPTQPPACAAGGGGGGGGITAIIGTAPISSVTAGATATIGLNLDPNFRVDASNRLAHITYQPGHVLGNASTIVAEPVENSLSNMFDIAFASTPGFFLQRTSGGWAAGLINYSSMVNISNNTVLGNISGGANFPAALTASQLTTLCTLFSSTVSGCVPQSGGGTVNFLRADGTWAAPAGGGGGITSINTQTGPAITIAAGTGLSVANTTNTVTVAGTVFSPTLAGIVPQSGGGAVNFLRADGTWASPATGSFLPLAGGTLTGQLNLNYTSPLIVLNKTATSGQTDSIVGQTTGNNRWGVVLGDSSNEGGGNSGSDFKIINYADAGTALITPFWITRSTGVATFQGNGVWISGTASVAPTLTMNKAASGMSNSFYADTNGSARWSISMGDSTAESGGNAGSNWSLSAYTDAGAAIGSALACTRSSALCTVASDPVVPLGVATKQYADSRVAPQSGLLIGTGATTILFQPYNGATIRVNGLIYQIPSGGIQCSNSGVNVNGTPGQSLASNTTYLVGLADNGAGALICAYLTSLAHNYSQTAGNIGTEIPAGNNSISVIGMVHTNASTPGGFNDDSANRNVASWFNRRKRYISGASFGGVTTTSPSGVNLCAACAIKFTVFSENQVSMSASLAASQTVNNTASTTNYMGLGMDGLGALGGTGIPAANIGYYLNATFATVVSDGYHSVDIYGATTGGTATFYGNIQGELWQ